MKFEGTQFFVKSHEEMYRYLRTHRGAPATLDIAERCALKLEKVPTPFPHFEVPMASRLILIRARHKAGIRAPFGSPARSFRQGRLKHPLTDYEQRLAHELPSSRDEVFRLLPDRVGLHPLREGAQYPSRAGRGSAAGALVAYSLGSTTSIRCNTRFSSNAFSIPSAFRCRHRHRYSA